MQLFKKKKKASKKILSARCSLKQFPRRNPVSLYLPLHSILNLIQIPSSISAIKNDYPREYFPGFVKVDRGSAINRTIRSRKVETLGNLEFFHGFYLSASRSIYPLVHLPLNSISDFAVRERERERDGERVRVFTPPFFKLLRASMQSAGANVIFPGSKFAPILEKRTSHSVYLGKASAIIRCRCFSYSVRNRGSSRDSVRFRTFK